MTLNKWWKRLWWVGCVLICAGVGASSTAAEPPVVKVVNLVGNVEYQRTNAGWKPVIVTQVLNAGDELRTLAGSRVDLKWGSLGIIRIPASTTLMIDPSTTGQTNLGADLKSGVLYFYGRDQPGSSSFRTPVVSGAIRGTEFVLAVEPDGRTRLSLVDGKVELANAAGTYLVNASNGVISEATIASTNSAPDIARVSIAGNIQWFLYYPGILVPQDAWESSVPEPEFEAALTAYAAGDLRVAAAALPKVLGNERQRVMAVGILLANGNSEKAAALLDGLGETLPAAALLHAFMDFKQGKPYAVPAGVTNATAAMIRSYELARGNRLDAALQAARDATRMAPDFGFAWARVAELEFGMGRLEAAEKAVRQALAVSPKNAQARSLAGFLAAARDHFAEAAQNFEQAIQQDGNLANAWLGLGLIKIRQGMAAAGREDLQFAAALEPDRSMLRSYLGKAFAHGGRLDLARKELALAKIKDPGDPTPWLYLALLNQNDGAINDAARQLRMSQGLNDNRGTFRSPLLLDQDAAVRNANLASIYQDAGLATFGINQAAEAVQRDYANHSAHQFLANSYDSQRRGQGINLRYESPAVSEYLISSLLAPVGENRLSRLVSQQEYSRLFSADHAGFATRTEYASDGGWEQSSAVYGNSGRWGFAADISYEQDPGLRDNQHLQQLGYGGQVKFQITPKDSVLLSASASEASFGDRSQYYDPASVNPRVQTSEHQKPNLFAGYHREWTPGQDTLLLVGRFADAFRTGDPAQQILLYSPSPAGMLPLPTGAPFGPLLTDFRYESDLVLYSAEIQHAMRVGDHQIIAGGRFQFGDLQTSASLLNPAPPGFVGLFFPTGLSSVQQSGENFNRESLYLYDTWEVTPALTLVGGLNYSRINYPSNFRNPPLQTGNSSDAVVSPKAGVIWRPRTNWLMRAQYGQSLGGISFDQSISLEPTLIAGLNQTYRSIIPESVIGSTSAARNETASFALEKVWASNTYVMFEAEWLRSHTAQDFGAYSVNLFPASNTPINLIQATRYEERSVKFTMAQLAGRHLALGASYRLSEAQINNTIPAIAPGNAARSRTQEAVLHQLGIFLTANLPDGWFARTDAQWYQQHNLGYQPAQPGDDFWQANLAFGRRFWNRRGEISLALLNLADQDYRLNPLNLYQDLPRERTLVATFKLAY